MLNIILTSNVYIDEHQYRNPRLYFFNPNARNNYEQTDYTDRIEGVCSLVPIFDDLEQTYGILGYC